MVSRARGDDAFNRSLLKRLHEGVQRAARLERSRWQFRFEL
jgi:hypothetical protein